MKKFIIALVLCVGFSALITSCDGGKDEVNEVTKIYADTDPTKIKKPGGGGG